MIVSNLQNSQRVEKLHPLFKQLFDYVKSHDLLHEELGTIRLDGDNLIVNNIYPECIPEGKRLLELHHDYIDVHILLEGKETIGWKALEELKVERQAMIKRVIVPYMVTFLLLSSISCPDNSSLYIRRTPMLRLSVKAGYAN